VRTRRFGVALITLLAPVLAAVTFAAVEIEKFHRVDDRVATGAQPTLAQIASLAQEGFRTVINFREPSEHDAAAEEAAVRDLGMDYVAIPVRTSDPKDAQADAFLKVTSDTRIYPVFIHCGTANRVAAFWMIRRMVIDGWSAAGAEMEAREIGLRSVNLRDFAVDYAKRHRARRLSE
jgi:uncharacterized protein (TIGR01244 family)